MQKLTRLLEDISFKASMAFGDFTGDRHRKTMTKNWNNWKIMFNF